MWLAMGWMILAPLAVQSPQQPESLQIRKTEQAPQIDGWLQEEMWQQAARIASLTQVEPEAGSQAQVNTEVLLAYDSRFLYLGFRCAEIPGRPLVRRQMRRDGSMVGDDRVEWILDTFLDHTHAYHFQLSAAGARADALLSLDGLIRNARWDGFWQAQVQSSDDGWTAEVAIPLASLSFQPDQDWGFNVERFRALERTLDRWATPSQAFSLTKVVAAGRLTGLEGLEQGLGLEFKPYWKGSVARDSISRENDWKGEFGGDLTWRMTPTLTGALTLNTDFAETEVDELQINLSRFPLFFPEKRDFFLEDSQLFHFGPVILSRRANPDYLPFHSRTLGLYQGQEVPLQGGLRLAGREGPLEMGFLAVQTEQASFSTATGTTTVPDGDLWVLRPAFTLSRGMRLGALLTAGDPTSDSAAQTAGVDFRLQGKGLVDGTHGLNLYWMRSYDGQMGTRDVAYGLQTALQTREWVLQYAINAVGPEFRPALGFVRRRGFHKHRLVGRWEPRPEAGSSWIRKWLFQLDPTVYTDLSNDLESYRVPFRFFGLENQVGDRATLAVVAEGDRPEQAFAPVPNSLISAGDHDWIQMELALSSAASRPFSAQANVQGGRWYDRGDLFHWMLEGEWRPNPNWRLAVAYQQSRAHLPGGDFTTRLERVRLDWLFSPDLSWQNVLQSDNISRTLGYQSRLRWILEDGREIFLVLESGWLDDGRRLAPTHSELSAKITYAFRF